jgi:hypothetical protein
MLKAQGKINYKLDIIIIAAILAVSIVGIVHLDMIFYKAGLVNKQIFMLFFSTLFFVSFYELSKVAIVLFAVIRIFFHLRPGERNKTYVVTALMSLLIFIGSWVFFFTLHQPGAVHYLRGYEKWVAKNIDIDSIQTWILSQEADKYLGHTYDRARIPSELPDFIRNVYPEWIDIQKNETGRCIKLTWPHGISEYKGIVIGSPAMKTKQEELVKHSNSNFEYRRSIKPGAYVIDGR